MQGVFACSNASEDELEQRKISPVQKKIDSIQDALAAHSFLRHHKNSGWEINDLLFQPDDVLNTHGMTKGSFFYFAG